MADKPQVSKKWQKGLEETTFLAPARYKTERMRMIKCPHCNMEFEQPKTSEQKSNYLTDKELEQANAKVSDMIASAKKIKYLNREKIPQPYIDFCDAYVDACGKDNDGMPNQEPTKAQIFDWMSTFEEWTQARLTPDHIREAYTYATRPDGGFPVGRPGALTKTAIAMKSKHGTGKVWTPIPSVTETTKRIEQPEEKYVPMPDSARQALKNLVSKKEIR
jgi:hypothetical protein